jgi:hypothetical protein
MAKNKVNKTQLVKDYLQEHPKAGPSEIAEALSKYKISKAYISTIKSKLRNSGAVGSDLEGRSDLVLAAARFIRLCGGEDEARKALTAAGKVAEMLIDNADEVQSSAIG